MSEQIYEQIKADILASRYDSSMLLTEQYIADEYHVSKTPAREALMHLCKENLLISYPRKGYVIKNLSAKEYSDMRELRLIIEKGVVQLLVEKASDECIQNLKKAVFMPEQVSGEFASENRQFHLQMARATGNEQIEHTLEKLIDACMRPVAYLNLSLLKERLQESHRQIIQAIEERDKDKAIECLLYDFDIKNFAGEDANG